MGIKYILQYHSEVQKKDIPSLGSAEKEQIKKTIEQKLVLEPEKFGKPLRKSLKGYRKLRVGKYRIVFRIEKNIVKILAIHHRQDVYQISIVRIKFE
ncbi:type II toxin-antitoxin system RelE/ParE family toxin [Candidatus Peregrinibacteria bacterium]|nr:type II toxin-antitoxin system RelE/ParE family toxin [Candidatus Peregrinibacteria bacterium]